MVLLSKNVKHIKCLQREQGGKCGLLAYGQVLSQLEHLRIHHDLVSLSVGFFHWSLVVLLEDHDSCFMKQTGCNVSELCEIGGQGVSDPEAEREPCGKVFWRSQVRSI